MPKNKPNLGVRYNSLNRWIEVYQKALVKVLCDYEYKDSVIMTKN